jgi:hypothetical protein
MPDVGINSDLYWSASGKCRRTSLTSAKRRGWLPCSTVRPRALKSRVKIFPRAPIAFQHQLFSEALAEVHGPPLWPLFAGCLT